MQQRVVEEKSALEHLARRFDVSRLELFGSATRGDFDEGSSDLDFLVEFDGNDTAGFADRYFGLKEGLEALFGHPVDLVVESAIKNPYFRDSLDRTRVLLYAS